MQVIVRLKVPVTKKRGTAARWEDLQRIAGSVGGSMSPLHPGTADATLASYYVIDVRDRGRVESLIPLLLQSPLVDAAYAKPPDALP